MLSSAAPVRALACKGNDGGKGGLLAGRAGGGRGMSSSASCLACALVLVFACISRVTCSHLIELMSICVYNSGRTQANSSGKGSSVYAANYLRY